MSYIKVIIDEIRNRNRTIEERVSIMFISIGVIASLIGEIISLLCHASIYSSLIVLVIALSAIISIYIGIKKSDIDLIRIAMIVSVSILVPGVFITAGGMMSGCTAWLIYELFYITLACKENHLKKILAIDGIVDICLLFADYKKLPFIYHLKTDKDIFISLFGSILVVAIATLFTVYFYKKLYNEEREYLLMQQQELEKASQFERNFLASMSHELRTPINSIIGFNDLILKSNNHDKTNEYAKDVKFASEMLLTKIDDILDFSRIQSGKMTLDTNNYNVTDLVGICFDMVSVKAKDKNLNLVVEADPSIPKMLNGDAKRIKQIILNTLLNAVKYSEKGTITFSIGVNKRQHINNSEANSTIGLVFKIADEGIGMTEEKRETIFKSFEDLSSVKVQNVQGSGMGLALTKSLVDLMNGEILVESTLGEGSVFTIIIPQTIVSEEVIGDISFTNAKNEEVDNKSSHEESNAKDNDEGKKLILVVDDTAMNLKLMKLMLKNYEVTTVDRGIKAIDACQEKKYALILMDIMMPEMDGVEAMKKIKSDCYADVPVIAVTADAVVGAKEEYLAEGFTDYVAKPVKADVLNSVINKYLAS